MARQSEIKAVRRVLYERKRLRKMLTEVRSIEVLMNTDPNRPIPPDDIRVNAGDGPTWVLLNGEVDPAVLEAAERGRRVAKLLRETSRDLKDVDFDRDDKRELRNALDAHAKAWVARADAWSAPAATALDPPKAAAQISRHDEKALRSYHEVRDYLDERAGAGL
jgi:hypothetical protein